MSYLSALLLSLFFVPTSADAMRAADAEKAGDSIGLVVVAEQAEPLIEAQSQAFDLVCDSADNRACEFKACDGPTCTIWGFDGERFVAIGKVDNIDYLIDQMTK